MRDIQITTVLNGYIVRVGCQTVVFGSLTDMLAEIRNYLNDPEATEKRYRELPNAKWTFGGVVGPATDVRGEWAPEAERAMTASQANRAPTLTGAGGLGGLDPRIARAR